jgi:hypothetical protein
LVQPSHQHTLKIVADLFPETSENHVLTRLSARENFIEMYSLYLRNAAVNNIVYNKFIERQRERTVSSPFFPKSDGSVTIGRFEVSLRRS